MSYRIVFSIDENFTNYLGVTIQSIIENSSPENNYIISILYDNLSEPSVKKLSSFNRENVKIEFYNVSKKLEELHIEALENNGLHWSTSTYYRILIPFLFKDDKKVLYMDCDTVVSDDIAKIFDTDLENFEAGVVLDFDTECYPQKRIEYIKGEMKLKNHKKYFNAGVVLFNIEKINKEKYAKEFVELAKRKFKFHDQDILNIIFEDKIKFLDLEWNYQYHFLFDEFKNRYSLNPGAPKLIHYTTNNKPWNTPDYPLCNLWWKYARKTDFYEEIIYKNTVYDFAYGLKDIINLTYSVYKILALIPYDKTKKILKRKIKAIRPFVGIIRRYK